MLAACIATAVSVFLGGTVRAAESLAPIPYATVEVVELDRRVIADQHGVYVFADLPAGAWTVRAEALGHAAETRQVRLTGSSVHLDFALATAPIDLAPITARASSESDTDRAGPGGWRIDAATLKTLPAVAEADVLRSLRDLPSVTSLSDFSSALYVRGGTPDQNLVLLDGATLLNPYHLGGAFTAVDPEAVSVIDFYAGGMPVAMGDRLSSELRIWTRDGGRDRVRGSGALGLISSRASVDGPLPGPGSFLISWRRTYFDLLTGAAHGIGLIEQDFPYAFTDTHLKTTYDIGRWGKLAVAGYLNQEHFGTPQGFDISGRINADWGTRAASATYRQLLSHGLLSEIQIAGSQFGGRFLYGDPTAEGVTPDSLDADVGMQIVTIRAAATAYGTDRQLRFGLQFDHYGSDYDIAAGGSTLPRFFPPLDRHDRLETVAFYAEEERQWGSLRFRAGGRLFWMEGADPVLLPRLGVTIPLSHGIDAVATLGRYAQAVTTLRNEESTAARLFAYNLLLPISSEQGPATSEDVVLGVRSHRGDTRIAVDGYLKWFHGLSQPPLPSDPDEAPVLVANGRRSASGRARGVEISLEHQRGDTRLAAAYALSDHDRTVEDERYTPSFERTHHLTLTASHPLGSTGLLSARVVWESGIPYTPATGFYRAFRYDPSLPGYVRESDVIILGEHNSEQAPSYRRVDVMVRKGYTMRLFGSSVTITPYFQVYNLLNNRNVLRAVPRIQSSEPRLEYAPQIPFLPTFGFEWKF